jgi:hypothetical protein
MIYIFDTSSFIVIGHYFPLSFPSFWQKLRTAVSTGQVLSVREVRRELDVRAAKPHLQEWVQDNSHIFVVPTEEEGRFVAQIFGIAHFQQLIGKRQRLQGIPVADPFVIAAARVRGGCVVTEETFKKDAAKIPNVCLHFGVTYKNLEEFMKAEGWSF